MSAKTFVAKKVGDKYVLQPKEMHESANRTLWIGGGAALATLGGLGLTRQKTLGVALIAAGACMIYRGTTGTSMVRRVMAMLAGCAQEGDSHETPSHQHDGHPTTQLPQDEVDEAGMESFPASDPPARSATAPVA